MEAAWTALAPNGTAPGGRYWHSTTYDPVRDRVVVFGGFTGTKYLNDAWALSLAGTPAWRTLVPVGISPSAREGHSAIYDPARDRLVVFGGYTGSRALADVWAMS